MARLLKEKSGINEYVGIVANAVSVGLGLVGLGIVVFVIYLIIKGLR